MLRRISLPTLFVIAAIVTMVLAAGGIWQFAKPFDEMLRALAPTWIGIAAVFWVLWRQIPPAGDEKTSDRPSSPRPVTGFEPLQLDRRYADISRLPLTTLDYVVIDTETTGTKDANGDSDAIVQIGAVRIVGGKVIRDDTFSRLVNPGSAISAAATRFHGITDDMVADAPGIEAVMAEFMDYAGDAVLIGHNVAVDLALISRTERIENPALDTMLLSIGAFETRRDHTLDALAEHFSEPVQDRHSALGDADLTARIFLRLLPELDQVGARHFGDAQDLCAHSADQIRDMGL
ncbi:MAG: DNA polymerase-3 subunit epsilon [Paracoccaceae bacterium]|jgi:DNA polymerase-3 subunit epsilon